MTQNCGSSKPGPKPDPFRGMMRRTMADAMSDRTFDTFWRAMQTIRAFDGNAAWKDAVQLATRRNGSLNVSMLNRMADSAVMRAVMAEREKAARQEVERRETSEDES